MAHVVVRRFDSTGALRDSAVTDIHGRFTFLNLPPGLHRLDLRRRGFARRHVHIVLAAGEQVRQRIAMSAQPLTLQADCLAPDGRSLGGDYCR